MNPTMTAVAMREPPSPFGQSHHDTISSQELIPLVEPAASVEKILAAWANFNELKLRLLDEKDFLVSQGQRVPRKSAFRKLALAFSISTELVHEERVETDGVVSFHVTMKAVSPNRRYMTAVGSCSTNERKFNKPLSDARATAETRATNRCIGSLLGWSQVSAEEVLGPNVREMPTKRENEVEREGAASSPESLSENVMTDRQRNLLVSLINQRLVEPSEREEALTALESYDKRDASDAIKAFLNPERV